MIKKQILLIGAFALAGCTPKLYVIDRQTILQSEATGEFPNLEKSLSERATQFEPKMADRSQLKQKQIASKNYQILNGELIRDESTDASSDKK